MTSERIFDFEWDSQRFKGQLSGTRWTLCIGAGVSKSISPDWNDLTLEFVRSVFGNSFSKSDMEAPRSKTSWGYEALLQAAINKLKDESPKSTSDYSTSLEEIIYSSALEKFDKYANRSILSRFLNNVTHVSRKNLEIVNDFWFKEYGDTTSYKIAEVVSRGNSNKLPEAIITFNADVVLHAMIAALDMKRSLDSSGFHQEESQKFYRVYRPLISNPKQAIPIYHLHGALVPKLKRRRDSRDRLVFLESSYLNLTKSSVNWPENVFLNQAMSSRLILVGISLSDQNMRRWLAWSSSQLNSEIYAESQKESRSTPHIWLTTKPKEGNIELQMEIIARSVEHLGVKVCWIKDWRDAGKVISHLTGL